MVCFLKKLFFDSVRFAVLGSVLFALSEKHLAQRLQHISSLPVICWGNIYVSVKRFQN